MNRLAEDWHCKIGVIPLEGLVRKKITPKRGIYQLTQSRPLIPRLSLRASKKLIIENQGRSHSRIHTYVIKFVYLYFGFNPYSHHKNCLSNSTGGYHQRPEFPI